VAIVIDTIDPYAVLYVGEGDSVSNQFGRVHHGALREVRAQGQVAGLEYRPTPRARTATARAARVASPVS